MRPTFFFDNGAGGLWEGNGTWIQAPSGQVNGSCHASLVSGPGVTSNTHVTFLGGTPFGPEPYTRFLTPSGQAELFAHNQTTQRKLNGHGRFHLTK